MTLDPLLGFLTPRRIRVYPKIAMAVIVLKAIALAAASSPRWWSVIGTDFLSFYTAGTSVRLNRPDLLYDIEWQRSFQSGFLGEGAGVSAWMNPPFFAWPFVALSPMPFGLAVLVHWALGLSAAALGLVILGRELPGWRVSGMTWAAATFYPTLHWLLNGQTSSLSLLIAITFFVLLRRGADFRAGLALGCLAYKPQLALGLCAALLGARRLSALSGVLLAGAAWMAASYATLPGATRDYLLGLPQLADLLRANCPAAGQYGLFQLATAFLDPFSTRAGTAVGIMLTAIALVVLAAMWFREPWKPGDGRWDRRMAATFALATFASPHLFAYDLMLLLLPFFIVSHLYAKPDRHRRLDGGALLATTALGWGFLLLAPALTVSQQALTERWFGRPFALQFGAILGVLWARMIVRSLPSAGDMPPIPGGPPGRSPAALPGRVGWPA